MTILNVRPLRRHASARCCRHTSPIPRPNPGGGCYDSPYETHLQPRFRVDAGRRPGRRAGDGSGGARADAGTNQGERIARAEVRRKRREGKSAARDVHESPARRDHPAIVQRLYELSRDGGRDDAGIGLRLPPDARSAHLRPANQPRDRRPLFILQSGRPSTWRSEAGGAESRARSPPSRPSLPH